MKNLEDDILREANYYNSLLAFEKSLLDYQAAILEYFMGVIKDESNS